ncbi:probable WRKY transcription factor 2 [Aristolochia californica]|uniref:probable WRKY transcription factor 2 n=1 Tax=Aristolochia californica TaxID=171875 RepID=UPI0035DE62B3
MDDNAAVVGEWAPQNPSPRTLFSSLLSDDFYPRSFSDSVTDKGNRSPTRVFGSHEGSTNFDKEDELGTGASGDHHPLEPNVSSGQRPSLKGGLAERMAARAGFNAPKLNTARIRCSNLPSTLTEVQSPYLTIPPGLSPTTLLDSPVFLANSLAQQSPTTGKLAFLQYGEKSTIPTGMSPVTENDLSFEGRDATPFTFKPHVESSSLYFASLGNKVAGLTNHPRSLPNIEVSVQSEHPLATQVLEAAEVSFHEPQELQPQQNFAQSTIGKDSTGNMVSDHRVTEPLINHAEQSSPPDDQDDADEEQRGEITSMVVGAPSEDGYNWRKYGQKQVKGSEFPRSYYKCTHPNCQVKKKVERSHEGHVTEIIYKGAHNHSKPPPNRRSSIGFPQLPQNTENNSQRQGAQTALDGEQQSRWGCAQRANVIGSSNWMHDSMGTSSAASIPTEFGETTTSAAAQSGKRIDTTDAIDVSSTMSNEDDEDDRGTHGSVSLCYDDEGDESESKRRKIDACVTEMSGGSRAVREPRVVVQTTSEVDILDDGYRWRKYGQKVVKGNPNPRSYYKCTNAGCSVRKHVERASHDLKSVITTYEGKHNHDVPAARNSSHVNSGPTSVAPAQPTPSYVSRPEPSQIHDRSTPGTFGFPIQPLRPASNFSFGMGQPALANLAMAGLGAATPTKMPGLPIHQSYFGQQQQQQQQQQRRMNEMGFMMPKGEPKEEPMSESGHPVSAGPSVYHQLMSRLPLGQM